MWRIMRVQDRKRIIIDDADVSLGYCIWVQSCFRDLFLENHGMFCGVRIFF